MAITTDAPLVAHKGITTIQEGSVYKERYLLTTAIPNDTDVRQVFLDSSGAEIVSIDGEMNENGRYIEFEVPYDEVAQVPNGAGFYCYLHFGGDPADQEHLAKYGTVFRRQLTFPDSPATLALTTPKRYEDSFQRPAGAVGGRWRVLVGQPRIFSNVDWFTGADRPNTVGPNHNFFDRYFMRYYVPFASDTITLSISATDKGSGTTIVCVSCSSDGTSFLYAGFKSGVEETIELGYGTAPDIGTWLTPTAALQPQIEPVTLTVPNVTGLGTYKMRYDDVTKTLGFYNDDYTEEYASWTDDGELVPHGKGYRYFAIGGNSTGIDSGVQVAYIRAQDDV